MTEKLQSILQKIDFKNRFDALFEQHSHKNLLKKTDLKMVSNIINQLGYESVYHKSGKFFKIDAANPKTSLNVSVDLGIVEFILDTTIDDEGVGGPFGYMREQIESEGRIKKPRFGSYEELNDILIDGFGIYEDIKVQLLKIT